MSASGNRAVFKNTAILYVRMAVSMLVALFTSRVLLKALGFEDFGIYNVVASCVVMFTFMRSVMIASSMRFFNFELGKSDGDIPRCYSANILINLAISAIFVLVSEIFAPLILNYYLNIPAERLEAANWVLQFSIILTVVSFMTIPYEAMVISHERMSFFACLTVGSAVSRLGVAYSLNFVPGDRLIYYSILLLLISFFILSVYMLYCHSRLCSIKIVRIGDRHIVKSILSFSGWSLLGGGATVVNSHGINLIINNYAGVLASTAIAIANQVASAVEQTTSNFQTAFKPQLIKSYAKCDYKSFVDMIFFSSKLSFLLVSIPALPIFFETDFILNLWLGSFPEYTVEFVRVTVLFCIIDSLCAPLWISVQAIGKIRFYQLIVSCAIVSNIPIALLIVYLKLDVIYILLVRVFINFCLWVWRAFYMRRLTDFPSLDYIKRVVVRIVLVALIAFIPIFVSDGAYTWRICRLFLAELFLVSAFYLLVMTRAERGFILDFLRRKFVK